MSCTWGSGVNVHAVEALFCKDDVYFVLSCVEEFADVITRITSLSTGLNAIAAFTVPTSIRC